MKLLFICHQKRLVTLSLLAIKPWYLHLPSTISDIFFVLVVLLSLFNTCKTTCDCLWLFLLHRHTHTHTVKHRQTHIITHADRQTHMVLHTHTHTHTPLIARAVSPHLLWPLHPFCTLPLFENPGREISHASYFSISKIPEPRRLITHSFVASWVSYSLPWMKWRPRTHCRGVTNAPVVTRYWRVGPLLGMRCLCVWTTSFHLYRTWWECSFV